MPRRDVDDPSQCPLRSPRFWEVLQACELGRDKVFGRDVPARKRQDSGAAMTDSSRSPDIQSTNKTANEPIIQSAGRNTCSWRSSRGQVPRQCLGAASSRSRQPARLGTLRESRRDFRKVDAPKRSFHGVWQTRRGSRRGRWSSRQSRGARGAGAVVMGVKV